MLKIIKYQYAEKFNNSWRRLPGYLCANKINWQKSTCKTEEQKYNKLTNAQIDALLTKNHG